MNVSATTAADYPDIEQLLDQAFGPNRHTKTAYRLREGSCPVTGLSFVIRQKDHLCASIEFWPIAIASTSDTSVISAVLLGPIAVAENCRGKGMGGVLIQHGAAEAKAKGYPLVVLVGDPEYYGRFGFSNEATANWILPGPVEQRRVLALPFDSELVLPKSAQIIQDKAALTDCENYSPAQTIQKQLASL